MDIISFCTEKEIAYLLPFVIFFTRIIDVSIGTLRVIFVSKGYKLFACFFGFFEILIWIIVISQVLRNLSGIGYYIAYAAGFSAGSYVGMLIEEKLAIGIVLVRVFTKDSIEKLLEHIKEHNYGATIIDGKGIYGSTSILYSIIPRKDLQAFISLVKQILPDSIYSVEDVKFISKGKIVLESKEFLNYLMWRPFRKGK